MTIGHDEEDDIGSIKLQSQEEIHVEEPHQDKELEFHKEHPKKLVIHSPLKGILTRSKVMGMDSHLAFHSNIEPKNFQRYEKGKS